MNRKKEIIFISPLLSGTVAFIYTYMIALRQCGHRFIDGNFPYGRCIPLSSSTIIIISIQFTFSPNAFFSCICHYNPAIKCICPRMQMPSLLLWCYSLERSSISLLNKPCNVCIQLYAQINFAEFELFNNFVQM